MRLNAVADETALGSTEIGEWTAEEFFKLKLVVDGLPGP